MCTSPVDRSSFHYINRYLKIIELGPHESGWDLFADEEYEVTLVEKEGKHRLVLTRG